jgi:hypothetical protein
MKSNRRPAYAAKRRAQRHRSRALPVDSLVELPNLVLNAVDGIIVTQKHALAIATEYASGLEVLGWIVGLGSAPPLGVTAKSGERGKLLPWKAPSRVEGAAGRHKETRSRSQAA